MHQSIAAAQVHIAVVSVGEGVTTTRCWASVVGECFEDNVFSSLQNLFVGEGIEGTRQSMENRCGRRRSSRTVQSELQAKLSLPVLCRGFTDVQMRKNSTPRRRIDLDGSGAAENGSIPHGGHPACIKSIPHVTAIAIVIVIIRT